ncbi:TIR domain-containing protein [Promicromonospora sukumoe]|uniref:TIR domain-containing protein n=1 Tax=Promicromonospora sukumoe TaxID=88382 RepID=UPI0037C86995
MGTVELTRPVRYVREQIIAAISSGQGLLVDPPQSDQNLVEFRERYLAWESRTGAILENSFKTSGFLTSSPHNEFTGTSVALLDLKIASTTIPIERLGEVLTDVREKLRVLRSVDSRLDVYADQTPPTAPRNQTPGPSAPIFLVHGRNLERREIVRRFLETVTDRQVVVLANQPNRGQDLLGKLLSNAQEAGFAVVLLTADDVGGLASGETRPRARQNVVFELGLFIALLGRDRVAALNDTSIEIPTDFSGVAYIPLDGESWQIELARELKAAEIAVSLDRVV